MERIGDRLKSYRKARGLSQRAFADAAGVSNSTLAGWELGYSEPRATQVVTMAVALGESADVLLGLKESPWLKEKKR